MEQQQQQQQHERISGYRTLTEEEIADVNEIKELGNRFGELITKLKAKNGGLGFRVATLETTEVVSNPNYDQRWVSIGTTHFQEGCSALVRAVTRPEGFI
jgi:hypothetical protein